MITDLLENKTSIEKADIKGQEIAKVGKVKRTNIKFSGADYDIEIIATNFISGGVEVFARVWDADGQIGFGKSGEVDIERFVFINPPILVEDENGDILREWVDSKDIPRSRRLREDLQGAILQSLAHTVKVSSKDNPRGRIISDSIGNTTSTFYPDAGDPGTTTVDGFTQRSGVDETWATLIAGAGTFARSTDASFAYIIMAASLTLNQWRYILRSMFLFDTSSIPDGDTISSATLSLFGTAKVDDLTSTPDIDIYTATPASNTTLAASDQAQYGTTSQTGSPITYANFSTTAYNDFAFNATGISSISKTGVSKFAARNANYDVAATPPTWTALEVGSQLDGYYADQAGTTNDPKLVVVHAGSVTNHSLLMGV